MTRGAADGPPVKKKWALEFPLSTFTVAGTDPPAALLSVMSVSALTATVRLTTRSTFCPAWTVAVAGVMFDNAGAALVTLMVVVLVVPFSDALITGSEAGTVLGAV